MARDTAPSVISSPHIRDFRAVVTLADLGPARLSVLAFPEAWAVRTSALIRQSDPERYGLNLITGNSVWFSQRDRDARVSAGSAPARHLPALARRHPHGVGR